MQVTLINLYGSDGISPIQDWLSNNSIATINQVEISGNFVYIFYT